MRLSEFSKWLSSWMALVVVVSIVVSRVLAFLIFECSSIVNDSGVSIKFAGNPAFLDYVFYKEHIGSAWAEIARPAKFWFMMLEDWRGAVTWLMGQPIKPGPLYPMLLGFSSFEESRYLLAWIYQVLGALLGWQWSRWLNDKGAALWLQVAGACFPALVYYAFLLSTDLLYAFLIAVWLVSARAAMDKKVGAWSMTVISMLLLVLARPNALALLPMMCLVAWKLKSLRSWLTWCTAFALVGFYMLTYYIPYYWVHDSNAAVTSYWGILPVDYYKGLWVDWPVWISRPLSWLLFAISKLMYAVGLRPSYESIDLWLVVLRALPGLLFFPGLIYVVCAGQWFDRWFVILFMLPIFIGASQERYLLALTPMLLLWGTRAWSQIAHWGRHKSTVL